MISAAPIYAAAPAKLNLYLHVVGRRPDGYHRLDSLVTFTTLHDTVWARSAERLTLSVAGPFASALAGRDDNLVLHAAERLADRCGLVPRAEIGLIKRLPVAAGLGGGSADAAATLRVLTALWQVDVNEADLRALGLGLGADVPVCLEARPAYVGGIGEEIAPAPTLAPAGVVLANPMRPLSTRRVFSNLRGAFSRAARIGDAEGDPAATPAALAAVLERRHNDLSAAAIGIAPEVEEVLGALSSSPGCLLARMSGSGATCFGLYEGLEAARAAAGPLAAARPGWWVKATALALDARSIRPDRSER